MQRKFGRWLRYEGGASYRSNGQCLYHKISDSALGFKPLDCFVLGIKEGTVLGEMGYCACAFELKIASKASKGSRIAFSALEEHQTESLSRSDVEGCGAFYVFGFYGDEGLRAYLIEVDDVIDYVESKGRGSFTSDWCEGVCVYKVEGLK